MGDSNAASHTAAMKIINEGIEALAEVSKEKDGLGLAVRDQQAGSSNSGDGRIDNFPSRAPKRKNDRGRPTNKRQKAGHENLSKRPRFCSLFVTVRCIHIRVALTVAQEQSSQGGLLLAVVVVSAGTRLTGVLGTLQKTLVPKICSCR